MVSRTDHDVTDGRPPLRPSGATELFALMPIAGSPM
jgi:hypothetical protein